MTILNHKFYKNQRTENKIDSWSEIDYQIYKEEGVKWCKSSAVEVSERIVCLWMIKCLWQSLGKRRAVIITWKANRLHNKLMFTSVIRKGNFGRLTASCRINIFLLYIWKPSKTCKFLPVYLLISTLQSLHLLDNYSIGPFNKRNLDNRPLDALQKKWTNDVLINATYLPKRAVAALNRLGFFFWFFFFLWMCVNFWLFKLLETIKINTIFVLRTHSYQKEPREFHALLFLLRSRSLLLISARYNLQDIKKETVFAAAQQR